MSTTHEQSVFSRIIDGDVGDERWREMELLGQADPAAWKRLAEAQRDHTAIACALTEAAAVADEVALPRSTGFAARAERLHARRMTAWSGWAVAALLAIVAIPQLRNEPLPARMPGSPHVAGISNLSPQDAFDHYIERGREAGLVVGEMPSRVLVDTRPVPAGEGYELLYMRQVLERTVVPDLYQFHGRDEAGQPALVRYTQPMPRRY